MSYNTAMVPVKSMDRAYNFSAGPAVLPESVLKQAQKDIWNINNTGIGILEHSHRGKTFDPINDALEADCRALANIPANYKVLFLTGGASSQFYQVPMNFLKKGETADYIVTGTWSEKAVKEAKLYGNVHIAATSKETNYNFIPSDDEIKYSASPKYVHFTSNNTIFGTEFKREPKSPAGVPVICDTSSDMFSRPIDVSKYAMIYAGAQKNLGPAGATLVIVREDYMNSGPADIPTMLQYRTHAGEKSLYNTGPVFAMYVVGLVFKWIREFGGLAAMAEYNEAKAKIIYDHLDNSKFFKGHARADSRSLMNITFRGPSEELEAKFCSEATKKGLDGLKGHRSVGGMRASVYNAFPIEGCKKLVEFMKEFETANR